MGVSRNRIWNHTSIADSGQDCRVGRKLLPSSAGEKLENHWDRRVRQVRADAPSVWAACRQGRRRGTVRHRRLDAPYPATRLGPRVRLPEQSRVIIVAAEPS